MRFFICLFAVLAFLACEASIAMHAHLIADPGGTAAGDLHSDGGSDSVPHGRIQPCHTCAHALPALGALATPLGWCGAVEPPLADTMRLAVGGAWPPLAEPPR